MSPATTALISAAVISATLIATAKRMSRDTLGAVQTDLTMDDLTERPGFYLGRHRDSRPKHWKPAHTKTAARRRAQLQHVRPAGVRPDRRIEQTEPLSLDRVDAILRGGPHADLGDVLRWGKGGDRWARVLATKPEEESR